MALTSDPPPDPDQPAHRVEGPRPAPPGGYLLQTMGGVSVGSGIGREASFVVQPKRLALLIYLALAETHRLRRRDSLAGLFWPDLDADHARAALSESLRYLRRTLGDEVVLHRGSEEVGTNPALLTCDVTAFREACSAERAAEALNLYRGPFLDGFFIGHAAAELEDWVTETRTRLATEANRMAWLESRRCELGADPASALRLGRWALEQQPMDEAAVRRLISLHDRIGDRTGALSVYDAWVRQVQEAFNAEPAPETVALIDAVKARTLPHRGGVRQAPAFDLLVPDPPASEPPARPPDHRAAPRATGPSSGGSILVIALIGVAVVAVIAWVGGLGRGPPAGPVSPTISLAVLPLENATGDTTLDYLASGLGESIRKLFAREKGLHVAPKGTVAAIQATPIAALQVGAKLGVSFVLEWQLITRRDSVTIHTNLLRVADGVRIAEGAYPVEPGSALRLEYQVVRDVAERVGVPASSLGEATAPAKRNAAAHLLNLEARWQLGRRSETAFRKARDLALRAIELEPLGPEGYLSLGWAYLGMAHYAVVAPEVGFPRADAAAREALSRDPSSPEAHGLIASVLAAYRWNWAAADTAFRRAIEGDPDDAAIRNTYGIMLRNTERYDEAIAQFREAARLDPLSRHYRRQIGIALDCAGRVTEAITEYRAALDLDPRYDVGWYFLSAALAHLGRYPEAIEAARTSARLGGDSISAVAFESREGRDGYLAARRSLAQTQLDTLRAMAARGVFVSEGEIAQAYQGIGDFDAAYRHLSKAVEQHDVRALTAFCPADGPPWPQDTRLTAIRRAIGLR